jgi:hypothetical protein
MITQNYLWSGVEDELEARVQRPEAVRERRKHLALPIAAAKQDGTTSCWKRIAPIPQEDLKK